MEKSSPSTKLHIMSLTTLPTSITYLPIVCTSSDAYPLIDMGPKIFKDPSLMGAYHGASSLIHPSTQVCVVSSNETNTGDTIPPTEASPHLDVPPVEEISPQEFLENPTTPLIPDFPLPQGKILVWETIPQAITQIPFFYPHQEFKHLMYP
jgi:hypothetical protein